MMENIKTLLSFFETEIISNLKTGDIIIVKSKHDISQDDRINVLGFIQNVLVSAGIKDNIGIIICDTQFDIMRLSDSELADMNLVHTDVIYNVLGEDALIKLGFEKPKNHVILENTKKNIYLKKYVIIESNKHSASDLVDLYGVDIRECYINSYPVEKENELIFLRHKLDNNYEIPKRKGK